MQEWSGGLKSLHQRGILLFLCICCLPLIYLFLGTDWGHKPTCANGNCFEHPTEPSPRTVGSARMTPRRLEKWFNWHDKLSAAASSIGERAQLVLVGDSITEQWLGSSLGHPLPEFEPIKKQFPTLFDESTTLILAASGDQTQHVLWRLQQGNLPDSVVPSTFVVHIGVNNLNHGFSARETAEGIIAIVKYIHKVRPTAQVVLLEVLPSGCANPSYHRMNSTSWAKVKETNTITRELLARIQSPLVRSVSCELQFLDKSIYPLTVKEDLYMGWRNHTTGLFWDMLHPNVKGHQVMAQCLCHYAEVCKQR